MRHPLEMGPAEVSEFLTWLAVRRHIAAATQNRTLNVLVFLYGKVLDRPLGDIGDTVLTRSEATPLIALLPESHKLFVSLMCGSEPLRSSSDTRTVKTLLRHADVRTTQIYTHILGNTFAVVQSPLGSALAALSYPFVLQDYSRARCAVYPPAYRNAKCGPRSCLCHCRLTDQGTDSSSLHSFWSREQGASGGR